MALLNSGLQLTNEDWQDYYNYLAKDSLERMKPFGDESFDIVEQNFPVEYVQAKPVVWQFAGN